MMRCKAEDALKCIACIHVYALILHIFTRKRRATEEEALAFFFLLVTPGEQHGCYDSHPAGFLT
jgi:hypothetical protein